MMMMIHDDGVGAVSAAGGAGGHLMRGADSGAGGGCPIPQFFFSSLVSLFFDFLLFFLLSLR